MKKIKILIKNSSGEWIDVSEKSAIIYGAGNGCIDLVNSTDLPGVAFVVDGERWKQENWIRIGGEDFKICNPNILTELDENSYYIIISSFRFREDILANLDALNVRDRYFICTNKYDIHYEYTSLRDMLLIDPFVRRKISAAHLSFDLPCFEQRFREITEKNIREDVCRFVSLAQGSNKLVFGFGNQQQLYVYSGYGSHNGDDFRAKQYGNIHKREIYEFKKECLLNDSITMYADEDGNFIQRYVNENVDFQKEEKIEMVLRELYKLHHLERKISFKNSVTDRYDEIRNQILSSENDRKIEMIAILDKKLNYPMSLLREFEHTVLCHGGMYLRSIVEYESSIFFIDWDALCMNDPLYDVCLFLYDLSQSGSDFSTRIHKTISKLTKYLSAYYGRTPTQEEYIHALAMMTMVESYQYVLRILYETVSDNEERFSCLIDHVNLLERISDDGE